jgi:hypothetical protein
MGAVVKPDLKRSVAYSLNLERKFKKKSLVE